MSKITKARRREIRADVAVYVADKLAGHTSWLDVPGVSAAEQEFVEDELLAIRSDLLSTAVRLRRPKEITEDRRPGLTAICEELAAKHPSWSDALVSSEAKLEWHRRNPGPRSAPQSGVIVGDFDQAEDNLWEEFNGGPPGHDTGKGR